MAEPSEAAQTTDIAPTDSELLTRFVARRDEVAFRELVEKHSRLVWGVCSRQLRFREDIEDAFQTTFVTLARKARTVQKRSSVASWLYKVAWRNAIQVAQSRSRRAEQAFIEEPETMDNVFAALHDREQAMILDEEVNGLPEHLRNVVVLCCIEGKTRSEAAAALETTEAAVKSKLARGRRLLRMRLARRGIGLSAVLGLLSRFSEQAGAVPPTSLIEAAVSEGMETSLDPPMSGWVDSLLGGEGVVSWLARPLSWLVVAAVVALAGASQLAISRLEATQADSVEQPKHEATITPPAAPEENDDVVAVLMTLDEEETIAPDDGRLLYLRVQAEAFERQAIAKRLEIEAYLSRGTARQAELNRRIAAIRKDAREKLCAATIQLAEFATMKGLWGEEEAARVLADSQINAADSRTDHARIMARNAERVRRFAFPGDPDPVLSQIEEATGRTGTGQD